MLKISSIWQAVIICSIVAAFRLFVLTKAEMPSGDEVNTYIRNAQELVASGKLPEFYEHPMVSLCYAAAIAVFRMAGFCLAGVLSCYSWFAVLGVAGALGLWLFLRQYLSEYLSAVCAVLYGCNPAVMIYPSRGDVNLFLALVPWAVFFCDSGLRRSAWRFIAAGGCLLGVLWLSRSDGVAFICLFLSTLAIFYIRKWRQLLVVLACLLTVAALYAAAFRIKSGTWGEGSGARAWAAFYQAEGLHDRGGGSWQDYTRRGMDKFGPPDAHSRCFAKMLWHSRRDVVKRVLANASMVYAHWSTAYGIGAWFAIAASVGIAFNVRGRSVALRFVVPVALASGPVFLFYFQRPYFVMFSGAILTGVLVGLAGWLELFSQSRWNKHIRLHYFTHKVLPACACLVFITWRMYDYLPACISLSSFRRLYPVLCELERKVREEPVSYITPPFAGSMAVEIYIDKASAEGGYELLDESRKHEEILSLLKQGNVGYILAFKERPASWRFDDVRLSVVKESSTRDLVLKKLDWAEYSAEVVE